MSFHIHSNDGNGNVYPHIQQNGRRLLRKMRLTQTQRERFGTGGNVLRGSMRIKVFGIARKGRCGFAESERGAGKAAAEFDGDAASHGWEVMVRGGTEGENGRELSMRITAQNNMLLESRAALGGFTAILREVLLNRGSLHHA